MIYIDPRAGSNKLLEKFADEAEPMMLDAGDIAFWGNGPDDSAWWIGIEYKQLEDLVACIKTGRFTGTQLPGMMRLYDISFLLIEGIAVTDRQSGQLVKRLGKATYGFGLPYQTFDNFQTAVTLFSSIAGKPCIVKRSCDSFETVHMIRDIHSYFQKKWGDHNAMSRPDLTKISRTAYDMEVVKVGPGDLSYPHYWLRKAVFQVQGIGWDLAGAIADRFGTMEKALSAPQKEWESIDRVGRGLAKRVFEALHGYPDPLSIKPKRKPKETNA